LEGLIVLLFIIGVAAFFYFLPWLVATSRHHHNQGGILILNALLGWTFIGWIAALVMACGTVHNKDGSIA
jgi:hypothetical protein